VLSSAMAYSVMLLWHIVCSVLQWRKVLNYAAVAYCVLSSAVAYSVMLLWHIVCSVLQWLTVLCCCGILCVQFCSGVKC